MAERKDLARGRASHGVDALIERLRGEGVASGRERAEQIVGDAERRARWLVAQAEEEAKTIVEGARADAEKLRRAGEDALKVAARDTLLELRAFIQHRFGAEVQRLLSEHMTDPAFLERLILEVAGRARSDAGIDRQPAIEVVLPRDAVAVDDLRRRPEELKEGTLSHFVVGVAGDMLREGVTFSVGENDARGIRVRLADGRVEVDLTDEAIASVVLTHLQPRFRALLEGIVK